MRNKTVVFGRGLLGSKYEGRENTIVVPHSDCDISSWFDVRAVLEHHTPLVVINCAGVVPKGDPALEDMVKTNALGPYILASECERMNVKLVHVSTNCVFGPSEGWHTEIDIPTADDFYGITKLLGEQTEYPALTVRTSFVGLPDPGGRGLLHWASTVEDNIIGYDKVAWNGTTTKELISKLDTMIESDMSGLFHIYSLETTTKYQLLVYANEIFGWNKRIFPESGLETDYRVENRTLASICDVGKIDKPIKQQLQELL